MTNFICILRKNADIFSKIHVITGLAEDFIIFSPRNKQLRVEIFLQIIKFTFLKVIKAISTSKIKKIVVSEDYCLKYLIMFIQKL